MERTSSTLHTAMLMLVEFLQAIKRETKPSDPPIVTVDSDSDKRNDELEDLLECNASLHAKNDALAIQLEERDRQISSLLRALAAMEASTAASGEPAPATTSVGTPANPDSFVADPPATSELAARTSTARGNTRRGRQH